MPETNPNNKENPLPPDQRRRGQKFMIRTAISNAILADCTKGKIAQLFIIAMGAQPWHVAMLGTFSSLAPLSQLVGLKVVSRSGKSLLARTGYRIVLLPLAALIVMALGRWSGQAAIFAGIAAYTAMSFVGSFANTAWWPLLQDVTAGQPKGVFFARMRTRLRMVELTVPVLTGWCIASLLPPWQFMLPFAAGACCSMAAAFFMSRVPERPLKVTRSNLLLRMRLAFRVPSVRAYLMLVFQSFMITGALSTYFILILLDRGMPGGFVIWTETVSAIGNVAGLQLWARTVDRHGGRSVLSLNIAGMAALGLLWLLLPASSSSHGGTGMLAQAAAVWPLLVWAAIFYILWGFFQGGFLMGRTQFLLDAIPQRYQADGFTMVNLAMAAGQAIGTSLGGAVFQWLTSHHVSLFSLDGRIVYLAAVQLATLMLWRAKTRLSGHDKQTPARRYLLTALGLGGNEADQFLPPERKI